MTEQTKNIELSVVSQYIKDLSFENPNAPASITELRESPEIKFNIDVNAKKLQDEHFEVELTVNATATSKKDPDTTIFVIELVYAGLFRIKCEDEKILEQIMLINCPTIIFPYARRIVSDVTGDAGLPPLMMNPISFEQIYLNRQKKH